MADEMVLDAAPQKRATAPALERGVRILDIVARAKNSPSLTEIARQLCIARSSAHALCSTLVQLDLLIRRSDQTYQLGPHVMRWSNAFDQQSDVATEFASLWDRETAMPGATITLSVLEGNEVVYIAARNSHLSHMLIEFRVGMRLPAAFTATGKAFLSHLNDFEVKRLYPDGLPPAKTGRSVQSFEQLFDELQLIQKNGYSVDDQQVAEGIICFGATVLNSLNRPIAAIAVSILETASPEERAIVVADVQRIAGQLSRRMGASL
jgi:DNA-binding IclR family transcriptional regulator